MACIAPELGDETSQPVCRSCRFFDSCYRLEEAFTDPIFSDYRGLKKRITAIRRTQQISAQSGEDEDHILSPTSVLGPIASEADSIGRTSVAHSESNTQDDTGITQDRRSSARHVTLPPPADGHGGTVSEPENIDYLADHESSTRPPLATGSGSGNPRARRMRSGTVTTLLGRAIQRANSTRGSAPHQPRFDMRHSIPLIELLPQLVPVERAFFEKLDQELDKVESFYCDRERELKHRYEPLVQMAGSRGTEGTPTECTYSRSSFKSSQTTDAFST